MERADVLPVLLEQRHEEVHRQVNILGEFIGSHVDVSDGNRQAQDFLHLELDGGLNFVDFLGHRLGVGEKTREFTSLVETGAEETWNLLDERLGGEEGVVFLGQLLHQLLVLVELLEGFGVHEWDIVGLGLVAMLLITENAHLHLWTRNVLQPAKGSKLLAGDDGVHLDGDTN